MITITISPLYVIFKHGSGGASGWMFDYSPSGFVNKSMFSSMYELYGKTQTPGYQRFIVPMDYITAIDLGIVTASELNLPAGMLAALQLLRSTSVAP